MSFLGPLAFADSPIQNLSIFDPASPPAASIRDLTFLVFAITGFIFVVVEGVLIYTLIRFRRSRNAGSEPPQVYGSKPIEIAWTAAPALIVFILILVTTRTLWEVEIITPKPKAGDGALFVTVTGRQWWWQYTYDHYDGKELGFTTANELHVPFSPAGVAKPIYLILESADVCHSFWVPRLAGKTDLLPGRTNHMWFQPDQPGLFVGQCAEYCGTQHANMLLRVVVEPQEDFERWLAGEQKPAVENPNLLEDKAAFFAQTCVNCHRIRGTPAAGAFGPDLTHLRSRATLASGMIPNTAENLRRWIDDPQKIKPGCLMPAFGLSDGDRDRIVAYLQSLR
ncbi:MAG TPA: cytochrome c oxidase subunit II [Gemmataceae bacterium]|nr:cytochrome c oxidase subunit II [Gemmataceae bacterium]